MTQSMSIGVLGTGTIASALVEGVAGQGHRILVSRRSEARSADLAARFAEVTVAENAEVAQADVVILGLMPDTARTILPDLTFRAGQIVISLMADVPLPEVATLVAPATAEAMVLPYPSVAQGGSPLLVLGETRTIAALVTPRNTLYPMQNEAEARAYLAAQAVLSPAVALVGAAAEWLGPQTGDAEGAEAFLRHLVGQSLQASRCAPLIEALNTPGGYNQRLRQHMEAAGMGSDLQVGLDALKSGA